MALYQLEALADGDSDLAPAAAEARRWVATRGGWLGRKRDSLGPLVLMRGMLLVIGAVTMIERDGVVPLLEHAAELRKLLGGLIPAVNANLRRAV